MSKLIKYAIDLSDYLLPTYGQIWYNNMIDIHIYNMTKKYVFASSDLS